MQISETIQKLITGFFAESLTQKEANELLAWLDESEENVQYFKELKQAWTASGYAVSKDISDDKAFSDIKTRIRDRSVRNLPRPDGFYVSKTFLRIAASVVFILASSVIALVLMDKQDFFTEDVYFEAVAPKGSRSFITLTDGTKIWLNADTRLRYSPDFGKTARDIYLEGEAYFDVSENKSLPFKVYTSDLCITALGTAFNVKSYNDEGIVETTLEEGSLQIETLAKSTLQAQPERIRLEPNQSAVFVKEKSEIISQSSETETLITENQAPVNQSPLNEIPATLVSITKVEDTRLLTSWKDARWIIKNEKLSELAPKLERRFDINIFFMSEALENYAITATLMEEPLEQVLEAMSLSTPIKFEVKSKNVYLYEDPALKLQYERLLRP